MAITYTVSYTFSPSTTISSSQVNTNFSDNSSTWQGIEAKTKTFSNLGVDTELKTGGSLLTANGTVAAPSISFTNSTGSGLYRIGADDIGLATAGVIGLEVNSAQAVIIRGVATNSSAAAGFVGEYIESLATPAAPNTTVWGDATSISLTAGDWDVTGLIYHSSGTTVTVFYIGISTTSGNSATGLVLGSNELLDAYTGGTTHDISLSIPNYRVSLAVTTTVYLKMRTDYSVGVPSVACRLSARRVR